MLTFSENAGPIVAEDTKLALKAVDDAFRDALRLSMTLVEANAGSNLPCGTSQKVYSSVNSAVGSVLEGRGHIVTTIRYLHAIKAGSNLSEETFGCPEEWTEKKGAAAQPVIMAVSNN